MGQVVALLWMEDAACASHPDKRLWDIDHPQLWDQGRDVCATCPVLITCRQWAAKQAHGLRLSGILGGLLYVEGKTP